MGNNSLFGKNPVVLSWGWVGRRIMYFKEQSHDSVVSKDYIHIQKSDIGDMIFFFLSLFCFFLFFVFVFALFLWFSVLCTGLVI